MKINFFVESDGISQLSATTKAIIITLAILLIILILILIFLAWYFGWCCWKGHKKDKRKTPVSSKEASPNELRSNTSNISN